MRQSVFCQMNVLILGDGNFSFSLALHRDKALAASLFPAKNLKVQEETPRLVCTSFDSRAQLLEKYQDFQDIERELLGLGADLKHGVNAWSLSETFTLQFDFIVWNHPHLGTEDFRLHRFWLLIQVLDGALFCVVCIRSDARRMCLAHTRTGISF